MKRLLPIALTALACVSLLPAVAQASAKRVSPATPARAEISDFDFGVDAVERAYAGYTDKTAGREEEYAALKMRLRHQIAAGRDTRDALAEYLGWFDDDHLDAPGVGPYRPKAKRRERDYTGRMKRYDPQFVHCRVDADTYLIRFPSCDPRAVTPAEVQRMVDAYLASGCENLILDIRGNSGGSDSTYEPLLRLLYDREGASDNMRYRVSAFSLAHVREFSDGSEHALRTVERMLQTPFGEFLPVDSPTYPIRCDTVSPLPKRAVLLIDARVGSSGEQLVLELQACSSRTKVCGKDRTMGCLDYSNCEIIRFPLDTTHWMLLPTTRSCRVDRGCGIDAAGIAPDVRIPLPLPDSLTTNVDTWVRWAADEMKTKTEK